MNQIIMIDSPAFKDLMRTSTDLRWRGKFREALGALESQLNTLHPNCLISAYLEMISAAGEGGFAAVERKYAELLAAIDPEIPVVKRILERKSVQSP